MSSVENGFLVADRWRSIVEYSVISLVVDCSSDRRSVYCLERFQCGARKKRFYGWVVSCMECLLHHSWKRSSCGDVVADIIVNV